MDEIESGLDRQPVRPKGGFAGPVLVVLVLGLMAGAGYWYLAPRWDRQPATEAAPPAAFAMPVEAVGVRMGPVVVEVHAIGTLRSNESVWLAPEIAGRLDSIIGEEGTWIAAGTNIAELDSDVYRAELEQAEAGLRLSEQNHRRATELVAQGAGTQRALDESTATLAYDRAAVELARARLAKTTITAPFEGILGMRRVSIGAYLSPGDPMINLEQINPLKLEFRVPESALAAVTPGRPITITVDSIPDRAFEGEIYAVDPLVDAQARSVVVRAHVPNPEVLLRPGLFTRVAVTVERRDRAALVPERAIVPLGEDSYVFRVVEGTAKMTKVRLGQRQEGDVEILEGLSPDDVVVTDGLMKIGDGMPVAVVPPPS
ncbi:MAG: efflux RND transporter periplasmic adaptor subunit [Alphaproteobacteria bacterium]|nr:efflux RND transporter periplasmic adaptor subunit [Alphaproteobacteria bacterium]